jgi:hypothetical protein
MHERPESGHFKRMNEGRVNEDRAHLTYIADNPEEYEIPDPSINVELQEPLWSLSAHDGPRNLKEALEGPDSEEWKEAYEREIKQMEDKGVWKLVHPPKGKQVIPCHVILTNKLDAEGNIASRKARIVAGGNRQQFGEDFNETFAAAAKIPSIRAVLGNAAREDYEIHLVDIEGAYLNAPLNEEVYMRPPPGYLKTGQEGMVLLLLKSIYGLHQSGRMWNKEMTKVLEGLGYSKSKTDHSVFYRLREENNEHIIVAVSTDDMALTANSMASVNCFKAEIAEHWTIRDLGELTWLLGFQVKRDRQARTISINQQSYIEHMLENFNLINAKRVSTPMDSNMTYSTSQCPSTPAQIAHMQRVPYTAACGSILWVARISRPDIMFATLQLTQFMQNPGEIHWEAAKRVITYLGGTKEYWLTFGGGDSYVRGYTDSDYATQPHRHSIGGFAFLMGDGVFTWSAKKQLIVAFSSTEAEYVAVSEAGKEAVWLRHFLAEINCVQPECMLLRCDNQGAIALTKDNKWHARTKHIDVRYHWIREAVEDEKIEIEYVPTAENIADIFTKALPRPAFIKLRAMLGLSV